MNPILTNMAQGLPIWSEAHIIKRESIIRLLECHFRAALGKVRQDIPMHRVEAVPLQPGTGKESIFTSIEDYSLRNETTNGSYIAAQFLMEQGVKFPFVVWQAGLSFRAEKQKRFNNGACRYKAFYQQEFQLFYRSDTKDDYFIAIGNNLRDLFIPLNIRVGGVSDKDLPEYATKSFDFIAPAPFDPNGISGGLEVASCSVRNDCKIQQQGSGIAIEVAEFAFGLDRLAQVL